MLIKCIDGPLEGQFISSDINQFDVRCPNTFYGLVTYKMYKLAGEKKIFWFFSTLPIDQALSVLFER